MVADQQRVLHRAARDVEGLHDEGVREAQKDGRDQQGLEVFAEDGALGHGGEAYRIEGWVTVGKSSCFRPNSLTAGENPAAPRLSGLSAPAGRASRPNRLTHRSRSTSPR